MASEFPGRGDARRSLALLWGLQRKPRRGPKPGLSVEAVVQAGIELADAEGLSALSMRRVAEHLGVGTMSLYTYVPAKAELLDLMVDAVYGEHVEALRAVDAATGPPPTAAAGWRAGLEARARAGWDLHLGHPWLLQVASSRAVLGPNETMVLEMMLRGVDGLGLTAREMVATADLVAFYVRGAVRAAADALEAPKATGMTDNEWWLERAPLLEELMLYDPMRFPTVVRASQGGGFDVAPDTAEYSLQFALDDFEFGLQRVLDGIESLIDRRATAAATTKRPARRARSSGRRS